MKNPPQIPASSPSGFENFLEALSALLPRGWRGSLQLEDSLTASLEEAATAGDPPDPRTKILALAAFPEGLHVLPEPWLLARAGVTEARLFPLEGERSFGRLLLVADRSAAPLDSERASRIRDLCISSSNSLERARSVREDEKFSRRFRRITAQELADRFTQTATTLIPRASLAALLVIDENRLGVLTARRKGGAVLDQFTRRTCLLGSSHLSRLLHGDSQVETIVPVSRAAAFSEVALFAPILDELSAGRVETIPLEPRGRALGSLLIVHEKGEESPDERAAVARIAGSLAMAFDRIRPERHQASTFLYLQELFRAPGRALAPLLRTVADEMVRFLGADAGVLALLNADTGGLLLSETRGYEGAGLPDSIPLEAGKESHPSISAQVVRSGEPYLASDTVTSPIYLPVDPSIRSEMGVPLRIRSETFGVALASSRRPGFFTTEDVNRFQLFADQVALAVDNARLLDSLRVRREKEVARLQRKEFGFDPAVHAGDVEYHFGNLVGDPNGPMGEVYRSIERVAARDEETVLIVGETGTGKEMVAHAIHHASPRRSRPMVATNFASLGGDPNLIQSELFGHEKGSFTGAAGRRKGCFETAHKSTLFIDEVGDVIPSVQVKLLRVLGRSTDRDFMRLGGEETIRTDVRVLAATNKPLSKEMAAGRFREDLYYRLSALVVRIPPLRSRKEDIPLLVRHFLVRVARSEKARLGRGAEDVLMGYSWPGNVRQLESVMLRGLILFGSPGELSADDARRALEAEEGNSVTDAPTDAVVCPNPPPAGWFWKEVWTPWKARRLQAASIEQLIRRTLEETGGFYSRAARRLGIPRSEYQRFLDFLTHAGIKVDQTEYRAK